jgi:RNA polymerase sigma-70 factor, ECF subfamily
MSDVSASMRAFSITGAGGAEPDVAAIYRVHGDYIFAMLARLGVREADCSDALQEVLVVVHRRFDTWDTESRITSWLYGICLRVASTHRRRVTARRETSVDEVAEMIDPSTPEEVVSAMQARKRLERVLDGMEIEKRAIFAMFELEERTTTEIAELLDVPVGTVHSRLHAARADFARSVARLEAREAHLARTRRAR